MNFCGLKENIKKNIIIRVNREDTLILEENDEGEHPEEDLPNEDEKIVDNDSKY